MPYFRADRSYAVKAVFSVLSRLIRHDPHTGHSPGPTQATAQAPLLLVLRPSRSLRQGGSLSRVTLRQTLATLVIVW